MKVVVDKNNPLVAEAFAQFGEVRALPTREITKESVRDVDTLIVRSETKVTRDLLDGSSVRFVGTATIGTDHVDVEYLHARKIGFASAPGSNANSVAEYLVASMLAIAEQKKFSLRGKTIGVVGVGNVGSKVVRNAKALGMTVLQNDPPRARSSGDPTFLPLDSLMDADVISLHVPLTRTGTDATFHLVDAERIRKMKKGAILVNTARGAVVDGAALGNALADGHLGGCILDVWEGEPAIDVELLRKTDIGTSHIAGYSYDGKLAAVRMMYSAACKFFGEQERWSPEKLVPRPTVERIAMEESVGNEEAALRRVISECYDIHRDDRALRGMMDVPSDERGKFFARLRSDYGVRREFSNTAVEIPGSMLSMKETLSAIGFRVDVKNK